MENITLQEIIDYKEGNKSATLNMAMAYNMPYIAEKEIVTATNTERSLMAAELLSTYNGRALIGFLYAIINYQMVDGLINNVSLLTIAKTMENDIACEYLMQYEVCEQGTEEEALAVINIFKGSEKVTQEDKLSFLLGEVKRIRR